VAARRGHGLVDGQRFVTHRQVVHDRVDIASVDRLAAHRTQLEMDELAVPGNSIPALAETH